MRGRAVRRGVFPSRPQAPGSGSPVGGGVLSFLSSRRWVGEEETTEISVEEKGMDPVLVSTDIRRPTPDLQEVVAIDLVPRYSIDLTVSIDLVVLMVRARRPVGSTQSQKWYR